MPPQLETHLPLLLDTKTLDALNRSLVGQACQFLFLLADGSIHCQSLDPEVRIDWVSAAVMQDSGVLPGLLSISPRSFHCPRVLGVFG